MKNFKGFAAGLVLGIVLAISSIGFAQSATQNEQPKNADSCCAMTSCCKGDSCPMKEHANKEHMKTHSAKDGGCCCCCGGDSCDMKMHNEDKPKG